MLSIAPFATVHAQLDRPPYFRLNPEQEAGLRTPDGHELPNLRGIGRITTADVFLGQLLMDRPNIESREPVGFGAPVHFGMSRKRFHGFNTQRTPRVAQQLLAPHARLRAGELETTVFP